jgi:predicted AAA+ superfamily ATPase
LYLYDTAFFNMLGSEGNEWKRLETIILWELIRRWETVYFKQNGKEIDFYSETTDTDYQICYELNNENIARELAPFDKSTTKRKVLIYVNEKDVDLKKINLGPVKGKNVKIIRFWDFLFNKI